VCGDVHGQYYDLLHIWELNGLPGPENPYLFNGALSVCSLGGGVEVGSSTACRGRRIPASVCSKPGPGWREGGIGVMAVELLVVCLRACAMHDTSACCCCFPPQKQQVTLLTAAPSVWRSS
jgi:hypothetical protein